MSIYKVQSIKSPNIFQGLFRLPVKKNFLIELENTLSMNEGNLLLIKENDIDVLKVKYKVRAGEFLAQRKDLLKKYIAFCIKGGSLLDSDKTIIIYLCKIFSLNVSDMKDVYSA